MTLHADKTFYAVMILYMGLKFGLFDSVSGDTFVMLAYLIVAAVITAKTVSDLNFMRKLPNFPFDGRGGGYQLTVSATSKAPLAANAA